MALARTDHDDFPGTAPAQVRDGGMSGVVGTGQVDVDGLAPLRRVTVLDPSLLDGDAGVGDHDIDAAEFIAGALVQGGDCGVVTHVDCLGDSLAVCFDDHAHSLGYFRRAAGTANHRGAGLRISQGNGAANATASAGDDGDFTLERF
ncbi:hypothetical protein D3C76_891750 [compost metagenome]